MQQNTLIIGVIAIAGLLYMASCALRLMKGDGQGKAPAAPSDASSEEKKNEAASEPKVQKRIANHPIYAGIDLNDPNLTSDEIPVPNEMGDIPVREQCLRLINLCTQSPEMLSEKERNRVADELVRAGMLTPKQKKYFVFDPASYDLNNAVEEDDEMDEYEDIRHAQFNIRGTEMPEAITLDEYFAYREAGIDIPGID